MNFITILQNRIFVQDQQNKQEPKEVQPKEIKSIFEEPIKHPEPNWVFVNQTRRV
jgi:hypothetical protein